MKRLSLIIILLVIYVSSAAQVLTSIPPYPTENDSIVIFYDATLGDGGLEGYTGDIFAHTGVTIDGNRWQNVIESWGNDNTQPQLERIGTDLYKLVIGDPHEFYSVSPSDQITELCFVFRSAGTNGPTGRDVGGADLFYNLFEPGLTAIYEQPVVDNSFGDPKRSPLFLAADDSLTMTGTAAALGTMVDTLRLQYKGTDLKLVADSILTYQLLGNILETGVNEFLLIASDTASIRDTARLNIFRNPPLQDLTLPAGVRPGITITGENSVVLALFAPYKEFVYVIGDFNDWAVDVDYFMNRHYVSTDSVVFWLEIDNLSPVSEYAFQYLVDGSIRLADPYTEKILDPWNDGYILSATYPNLKSYPDGKTEQAVATFQILTDDYTWNDAGYTKPEKHRLVIYELLVRDFLASHSFETLLDTLDYLENLGINAIELMPVNEFEGNSSWGYNPSFYFAVDKYYGPAIDLKKFIDECHARGIAVIIDMVLNHSYGQSPLVRLYWNDQLGRPAADNPWYNEVSPNSSYSWGYDFDHQSEHTKAFVDRVNRFWIEEYHVDGFRFDFTKGFTNTPGDGWSFDGARISILQRMADEIWTADPTNYVILEHFADNSEERVLADYGMMVWSNNNHNYAQISMGYPEDSDFSWGFYQSRGWTNPHLVTYMESHDEERLMYKNLTWGNSSGDYDITELETAPSRQKLANALFLTLPGPKMIWQFGELGYDYSIDENGRVGEKPIRWDYFRDRYRYNLYQTIQALLTLRNDNSVFTSTATDVSLSVSNEIKQIRLSGDMEVLVIGNMDVVSVDAVHNFPWGGTWYDYFSGDSIFVELTSNPIALAPGEFHIYTNEKLETPVIDPTTAIDFETAVIPEKFSLYQNYPNPFNPTTRFKYDLEKTSDLEISISDLTGRKVWQIQRFGQAPGTYSLAWDSRDNSGRNLQSGIYFLVLQRGHERRVQKITLLK